MLIFVYDVIIYDVSVTPSTIKMFMNFWGACFKFRLRPSVAMQFKIYHLEDCLQFVWLNSYFLEI